MEPTTTTEKASGIESPADAGLIEVTNPASGEPVGAVPKLDAQQVAELVAKARSAQPAWQASGFGERARVFRRARQWLVENQERMAQTIISETGKTDEDAGLETTVAIESFAFWAKRSKGYLKDERVPSRTALLLGRKVIVRHEPLGVIGVIGPWNYPLVNAFCDCVPALMAGNSVVMKPSKETPLTALLTAEMMRESGLPDGVLEIATGDRETGEALIDHTDFVMFTGSTETGRKVMERAAKTMTQVSLELGGKDPMIVLADANLDRAANAAAYFSMNNGGQVCISAERAYVEEPVYDRFVEMVTERVEALRQGPAAGPGTVEVGAVTVGSQLDLIDAHVADAVAKGATVLTGGKRGPGPGHFYEPTVLVGVDHSMQVHDRGDLRPNASDHEGAERGGGDRARQRLRIRPAGVGLDREQAARGAGRAEDRGGVVRRQRRPDQLRGVRRPDERLEAVRRRRAPRGQRDSQVLPDADDHGEPVPAQARPLHVPLHAARDPAAQPRNRADPPPQIAALSPTAPAARA